MFKLFKYYLLRPFLAWMLIFALFKSMFVLFHWEKLEGTFFSEKLGIFSESLRLDISSTAYILIVPFFLMIIQYFIHNSIFKKIAKYYHYIILFFVSGINVIDILLYSFWDSKVSLKAFQFIQTPMSVINTTGTNTIILGIAFLFFHFFLAKYIIDKFSFKGKLIFNQSLFSFLILVLISTFLLIVSIRGGFQGIPINQSIAYYSKNNTLNIVGVNPFWNFMNTIVQNKKYLNENPYVKLEDSNSKNLLSELYKVEKDTSLSLFNLEKPNIVFIAMEGVNANVFETFGSKSSYTPNIDSLFSEGYLFTEFYSSGFRSDQGMLAILGGFPPTPVSSITSQPEKFRNLPSLSKRLKEVDYNISYFMGGEPEFGNLKSYLVYNDFDKLIDIKDFSEQEKIQSLGASDEFLFKKFNDEMKSIQEPFFSLIFTGTTHEPYDMDFNDGIQDERQRYLNTVSYLDTVFNSWLNSVKKMPWYHNTIFILTSDHAHFHPGNYYFDENARYHIPLLFFGEPLKVEFKNKENHKISSQVDIPKTILEQLNLKNDDFKWSKDLMNPYANEFAFYTYVEGCVLKTKHCNNGWEYRYDKPVGNLENRDSTFCIQQSQAFLQELYEVYLSY